MSIMVESNVHQAVGAVLSQQQALGNGTPRGGHYSQVEIFKVLWKHFDSMSLNYVNQMEMGEGPVIFTQFGNQVGNLVCKNKICFVCGTENHDKSWRNNLTYNYSELAL